MRNLPGRTGIRALAVAAIFGVGLASSAIASPISANITYETTGFVGDQAGTLGSPVVFHGVDNGSFATSTSFNLGEFEIVPPSSGDTSPREVDMPFQILYSTKLIDGATPSSNETPVVLSGRLMGTLNDGSMSHLEAIFDQGTSATDPKYYMPVPPFQTGDLMNSFSVNHSELILKLATDDGAQTSVEAQIDVTPVPEPSSLSIFALIAIGIGLSRRSLRGR